MRIESCRFGMIFVECKSNLAAVQLNSVVTVANWGNEGLPAMTCDEGNNVVPAPVTCGYRTQDCHLKLRKKRPETARLQLVLGDGLKP